MKIGVLGIGKFGAKEVKNLVLSNVCTASAVLDWRNDILSNSLADCKIRIKKSADISEELLRVEERLADAIEFCEVIFLIADMSEEIINDYAIKVARLIKNSEKLIIGITTIPLKSEKKRYRNQVRNAIYCLQDEIAVAAIQLGGGRQYEDCEIAKNDLFDSLGNYSIGEYIYDAGLDWDARFKYDIIGSSNDTENVISTDDIVKEIILKIVKMLQLDYINVEVSSAKEFLKHPGGLHIASAHNDLITFRSYYKKVSRAYILERKLTHSALLQTALEKTKSILLHLILPSNVHECELEYLCEHIPGRAGTDKMNLAITVDDSLGDMLRAEIIATDAYTDEEWQEMME